MKNKTEKSYIYFTNQATIKRNFKIGQTASMYTRSTKLWSDERMAIARYVSFNGTLDERLFIESYVRMMYCANSNLVHCGSDHFKARTENNRKGAENKFFQYVAEAFALIEQRKGQAIPYNCHVGKWNRWDDLVDDIESL